MSSVPSVVSGLSIRETNPYRVDKVDSAPASPSVMSAVILSVDI